MDTRMLDVAIGLTLVFALFGLLVTVIEEAHAALRNDRGKNMFMLVCSLAGDNRQLAQQIMDSPFLQTMMMERSSGKPRLPSYLESDVFVTGLLAFLISHTAGLRPSSPSILVQELKRELQQIDPRQNFASNLDALLPGAENDWPALEQRLRAWFNAVGERATGWYKRKVQAHLFVYGFVLAVALNVNPIVITEALWRDAALRSQVVAQADVALLAYYAHTGADMPPGATTQRASAAASTLPDIYRDADRHLVMIRQALDSIEPTDADIKGGAAEEVFAMRRMVLKMKAALTLERASASTDPQLRQQQEDAPVFVDVTLARLREAGPAGTADAPGCGLANKLLCPVAKLLDQSITGLDKSIRPERAHRLPGSDAASAALTALNCQQTPSISPALLALCTQLKTLGIFDQSGIPLGWSEAGWPRMFSSCKARERVPAVNSATTSGATPIASSPARGTSGTKEEDSTPCREPEAWRLTDGASLLNWGVVLAGWLVTATSAMLGAPFWFDMLSKLVKLRNSGVKPLEPGDAGTTGGAPAPSTLSPGTAQVDEAGTAPSLDAFNETERQLSDDEIIRIQRNLGMPSAQQSGRIDLATRTAIVSWQRANGANAIGELTQMQAQQILLNSTLEDDDGYVG